MAVGFVQDVIRKEINMDKLATFLMGLFTGICIMAIAFSIFGGC